MDNSNFEEIEDKYKTLVQRRDSCQRDKDKIDAELSARRRALKEKLDQAKKEGIDPDHIPEELKRLEEVLTIKLNTHEADLDGVEKIMRPMKASIEGM